MRAVLLPLLLVCSLAQAEVIHLTCETRSPSGKSGVMKISLDEEASTAVFSDVLKQGLISKERAIFTGEKVLFRHDLSPSPQIMKMVFLYELDRETGVLSYHLGTSPEHVTSGPCTKTEAVARKF